MLDVVYGVCVVYALTRGGGLMWDPEGGGGRLIWDPEGGGGFTHHSLLRRRRGWADGILSSFNKVG